MDDNKKDKKGQKFYIVPQTEEKIERNRKIIEEMRSRGLLEKYEKTFQFLPDGSVIKVEENKEK